MSSKTTAVVLGALLFLGLIGWVSESTANPLGCWKCTIDTFSCQWGGLHCHTDCEYVSDGNGDGISCLDNLGLWHNQCNTFGGACLAITVEVEEPDCRDFCP
ncbi:MAG: hypothetical protein AAF604_20375 [Acidobacteriota bacterium]